MSANIIIIECFTERAAAVWVYSTVYVLSGRQMQYWRTMARTGRQSGSRWHRAGSVSLSTSSLCLYRAVCPDGTSRTWKERRRWRLDVAAMMAFWCDITASALTSTVYWMHWNDVDTSRVSDTFALQILFVKYANTWFFVSSIRVDDKNVHSDSEQSILHDIAACFCKTWVAMKFVDDDDDDSILLFTVNGLLLHNKRTVVTVFPFVVCQWWLCIVYQWLTLPPK